ncbi:C1 family peptidase [Butyrivibrio sp. AE2032]|uniref:C1 family peptidase n=1 Tax=Butyrivibrio sp. AE2032 TaxID=1458463 RepID=UPI000558170F|nr:C1 family peptidase [Butyrivibrio sp. AE2032]
MKRNFGIIVVLIPSLIVCLSGCGASGGGSSRRDGGGGSDEDLALVSGDEDGNIGNTDESSFTKNEDAHVKESIVLEDANQPVTENVQAVRKVLLSESVTMGEGDAGAFYSNQDFKDIAPADITSFSAENIPEKYDSRDVDGGNYITTVEDQGYSYLCWTFASMGAVESDILRHHDNIANTDMDLSEKHLAYYNVHRAVGSRDGYIDDDYRELVNADGDNNDWIFDYDTGYISVGGVSDYCINLLTAWKGPVDEEGGDAFDSVYGSANLFTDNASKPSEAYGGKYHVQGAYCVPGNIGNSLMLKQMIMEHGSVTIGVNASSKFFKDHSSTLYSTFDGETAVTADHEVLIIGWDDNYSADNFKIRPEGDGAWLCKNSWGKVSGKDGCFYLSYYDETAAVSNATAYHVAMEGDENWYDNNYQVAGFFTNVVSALEDEKNMVSTLSSSANPYGVLYKAIANETLKAIGFMSLDLYQQYEVGIYLNPVVEGGDISFEKDGPVLTQKISSISGGFHTFELDKEIELDEDDSFFILVKPVTEGRLVFEQAGELTGDANYDEWHNLTGNIHNSYSASGCSYYISDDGKSMVRQEDKDFFIKAYTNDK